MTNTISKIIHNGDEFEFDTSSVSGITTTQPSNPSEGAVYYDTTNDVVKVYDGTNWVEVGKEYSAGKGIGIGTEESDMKGPAPSGFHVPLNTEWQAVYDVWTALGGGVSDGTNFGIALKLPFAGYRNSAGVSSQGSRGRYWSSFRYSAGSNVRNLNFTSSTLNPQSQIDSTSGLSVRCFKNFPVIPTSSWIKLYGTSIEAGGIFWSSADGLISLSSDGQTWITMADKNLGATTVWNSGDTLSEANCGKYYQWGNNYGFPRTGTVTTSSTQVDASSYGPGNYYSSDIFITASEWSSVYNDNLWGGTSKGTWISNEGNTIINTGVLSVNGQTGDVTIDTSEASSITTTQPSNPSEGAMYYDTTNDVVKVYDGTNWNVVGDDAADINTKTFYLSGTSDLTNAQAAYDWYVAGKNPIIVCGNVAYMMYTYYSDRLIFASVSTGGRQYQNSCTETFFGVIMLETSQGTVTNIIIDESIIQRVLSTNVNYSTPYTPTYDGSPATKKYVDDNAGITNDTTGTTSTIEAEWVGTQAEFNALSSYGNKIYNIIE